MNRKPVTLDHVNEIFELRGFNKIALVCGSIKKSVDFYTNLLGMKLIHQTQEDDGSKRCLIDFGNGVDRLELIWFPDGEVAPGIATSNYLDEELANLLIQPTAALIHICYDLPLIELENYRKKLKNLDIDVTLMRNDMTFHSSFYFKDPDGINIEFGANTRAYMDGDLEYQPKADVETYDTLARD